MPDYDLKAFLDDDPLVLEGVASETYPDGHAYTAPDLPHRDKLRLIQILVDADGDAAKAIQKDGPLALLGSRLAAQMRDFCTVDGVEMRPAERLLGDAYRQMVDDGVSSTRIDRIEIIAILHYAGGQMLTENILKAAAGEAAAPANRGQRRAAAKKPAAKRTSSAAKAGSRSNRASSATSSRTTAAQASTASSRTSAAAKAAPRARKTA